MFHALIFYMFETLDSVYYNFLFYVCGANKDNACTSCFAMSVIM